MRRSKLLTATLVASALFVSSFTSANASRSGGEDVTPIVADTYQNGTADNGGAFYQTIDSVINTGAVFKNNSATSKGGAIYNNATMEVGDYVTFEGNSANWGAGIFNDGASAVLTLGNNIIFKNNYLTGSDKHGSALYNYGGKVTVGDGLTLTKNELGSIHDCGIYSNMGGDIEIGDNFNAENFWETMVIAGNHTLSIGDNMTIKNGSKGINLWGSGIVTATIGNNALFENNTGRVFEIKDYAAAGSKLTIGNNIIVRDNNLTESGDYFGNVYNSSNSEMIFSGSSEFINNTTQRSNGNAGVFQNWGKLTFAGNTKFDSNSANGVAGALRNRGAASDTEFNDIVEFTANKALKDGGAIINEGSLTFDKEASFSNNIAGATKSYIENINGIYASYDEEGNLIGRYSVALGDVDTSGSYNGGAIHNTRTVVFNDKAEFIGNKASGNGGAIYNEGTITSEANSQYILKAILLFPGGQFSILQRAILKSVTMLCLRIIQLNITMA